MLARVVMQVVKVAHHLRQKPSTFFLIVVLKHERPAVRRMKTYPLGWTIRVDGRWKIAGSQIAAVGDLRYRVGAVGDGLGQRVLVQTAGRTTGRAITEIMEEMSLYHLR